MPKLKLTLNFIKNLPAPDKQIDYFDTESKGLLLRVYPSERKVFQIYYRNNQNKQKRYTIAQYGSIDLNKAREIAAKRLGEIADGIDVQSIKKVVDTTLTFKEFLDEFYIKWVEKNHKHAQVTVNRLNNALRGLHNIQLSELDKTVVNKFLYIYQDEHEVSEATLNRLLANIKGAMTKAYEFGYVNSNILTGAKSFKENDHKIRYLSESEKIRLFKVLENAEKYIRDIVYVAYYTGMRRGEIFSLQWNDIDFDAGHINIDKDKSKSGKGRNIPMHSKVIDVFKNIEYKNKSEIVFKSPVTSGQLNNITKSWHTLMKNAEIESFRFHDLRHNFASTLVMKGVELASVRELLGHSDFKMTLRYAHLSPSYKKKDIDLMD